MRLRMRQCISSLALTNGLPGACHAFHFASAVPEVGRWSAVAIGSHFAAFEEMKVIEESMLDQPEPDLSMSRQNKH